MLPHLKLSVIGLRSFYSPDERVELYCSSDFSRPAGALAWFINGQRVSCWRANRIPKPGADALAVAWPMAGAGAGAEAGPGAAVY